jgi:trimethylamine--corrinoid protein Co-methyltransferase
MSSNVVSLRGNARNRRLADRAQPKQGIVKPGLAGGHYKPLSDHDITRIHQTALTILEEIGMGNATPEIIETATAKGAFMSDQGRLCFPRALVEDLIASANKDFILYARDPKHDAHIKDGHVYFRTTGEAVSVLDYKTRSTRSSTLLDVYDFARLADQLSNVHTFGQTVVATEYSHDAFLQDMNVLYAQISGTQKHSAVSTATPAHVDAYINMLDIVAGGEGEFVKRPFVLFGGCPVVSPLRFGTENADVLVRCAKRGVPYDIAVASQAGATAPAALAGSLAQTFAETLAAMAVFSIINPTAPFLMGSWPFISDLRTGSFTGGSGEQALVSAASAQLINFYGLPSSLSACMTDSKLPDNQAGFEKAITASLVAHAGGNYIGEAFGMLGSLMACSFEAMIIDNDMVGNILRTLRGIEVNDATLSLEVIRETVNDTGHFLGHPQTLDLMESEYLYPRIADRQSYGLWEQTGKKDAFERVHEEAKKILSSHYPSYLDPGVDEKIRAAFPIMLKPEDMRAGNGRWS